MEQGKYIVIEGHDGVGKGEQTKRLASRLGRIGISCIFAVEPGGTKAGQEIRRIVKNDENKLDGASAVLLFTAARRDLWQKVISPNLALGNTVISDRNWLSSIAYQVYGQQAMPIEELEQLTAQMVGEKYLKPDLSLVLNLDEKLRAVRLVKRGDTQKSPDAFESKDSVFQLRVKEGYLKAAEHTNSPIIDAEGMPEEVHERIWEYVEPFLSQKD